MELAIPKHLQCLRSRKRAIEDQYEPPYPAAVARFDESIEGVVMANIGIQYRADCVTQAVVRTQDYLRDALQREDGPRYADCSKYTDTQGYTNQLQIAYWRDPHCFQRWVTRYLGDWLNGSLVDPEIGTFLEVFSPSVERLETLFSSASIEGVANLSEQLSGPVQEHGYWGSMRDRLALSQNNAMKASGAKNVTQDAGYQRVEPHENLCLIRSGQDWSAAQGEERQMYLQEVEPVLQAGMDFLSTQGAEHGCYSNRYLRILGESGELTDRSFGLGLWRDIADLEQWSKSHATHQAIFGAAMSYLGKYAADAQLKLYHEVMVVSSDQQSYEYFNCHSQTGMLRA